VSDEQNVWPKSARTGSGRRLTRRGPIEAGSSTARRFPSKGRHSGRCASSVLRAARQAGQLPSDGDAVDRQPSCQPARFAYTAVSAAAVDRRCVPVAKRRMFRPRSGSRPSRRLALEQIRAALKAGVAPGVVLMDASYGNNSKLRQDLTDWAQLRRSHHYRPSKYARCARTIRSRRASAVERIGAQLAQARLAHRHVAEGTNRKLAIRALPVCGVRAAPIRGEARFAEETLLIEWPKGPRPSHNQYWLTTVDPNMSLRRLVISPSCAAVSSTLPPISSRNRLGHYEGRGCRVSHHQRHAVASPAIRVS